MSERLLGDVKNSNTISNTRCTEIGYAFAVEALIETAFIDAYKEGNIVTKMTNELLPKEETDPTKTWSWYTDLKDETKGDVKYKYLKFNVAQQVLDCGTQAYQLDKMDQKN